MDTKEDPIFKRPLPKTGQFGVTEKPLPPSNEAAEKKELEWRKLMYDYTQNTSLHGIRYTTTESRFILRRIIWTILVVTALTIFIYYAYNRVSFYLQFNKNVNVEVNYLSKLPLPAVTLCNQNMYRLTPVAENGWYDLVKSLSESNSNVALRMCYENEFRCHSTGACLPLSLRCDMFPDCPDGSDETICDPCPMLEVNGPSGLPAEVIGRNFIIQPNTYNTSLPVYVREDTPVVFLFENGGTWYFADHLMGNNVYAKVMDTALSPEHIVSSVNSSWQVYDNTSWQNVNGLTVTCKYKYMDLLAVSNMTSIPGLTLETLSSTASHEKDVFVQKCVWKGKVCQPDWIQARQTDMGTCYTFLAPDMNIEQAGPGYGLSLTLNIEYYEYTKSAESGLGVKLLMHNADDVAMVAGQGTAVSPGLYSFISIETTTVSNQPPPWGECGPKDLTYYNDYSVARCLLDCETTYAYQEFEGTGCGCRSMHMPNKAGEPPVCTVDKYVNCINPAIDEIRAAGNYCSCGTPCLTDTYVPTTSFSIVLSQENSETATDEKSAWLREKLQKAREIRYRVVQNKKLEVTRNFQVLTQQLSWVLRFAQASSYYMVYEYQEVSRHVVQSTSDCIWIRDTLQNARKEIENKVLTPLNNYKGALSSRAIQPLLEMKDLVQESINTIDSMQWNGSASWIPSMLNTVSRNNDTTWQYYARLYQTLEQLGGIMRTDAYTTVNSLNTINHLRLKQAYITLLLPAITSHCPWCVDSSDTAILQILENRVKGYVGSGLTYDINNAKNKLYSAYSNHLKDLWIANATEDVANTDRSSYYSKISSTVNSLNSAMGRIQDSLDDANEVLRMLDDLLEFRRDKCSIQLPKLSEEYNDIDVLIGSILHDIEGYLSQQVDTLADWKAKYDVENITLEYIGTRIPFVEITRIINDNKVSLDAALNERMLALKNLQGQIYQTHYVFIAIIQTGYMASQSAYWQSQNITNPGVQLPSTITEPSNSVTVPLLDFKVLPGTAVDERWLTFLNTIQAVKDNLQLHVEDMISTITITRDFFTSYVTGNQLNSEFYSKNFLQIELFYKELTERKVSQQKAYEYPNLLSELGGFMGLLLGASVLSIFEVADLFMYNGCRKCCKKKPRKTVPAWQK